jgi:CDP-diacylglycerol--serine O-phosphatidyltransferase
MIELPDDPAASSPAPSDAASAADGTGRPARPRRLSKERLSRGLFVLPTLFTVGNLFCGYLSLWSSINGTFERSAWLIVIAAVLDMLDGRIARLTNSASEFGEEYDSLADLVSFGVAPAILVYSWGLADFHRLGLAVSFFFVVCGSMRLARFNIQTHIADKRYFVGLPIPAAAGTICTLVLATPDPLVDRVWMTAALIATFILSYLMISTIRYRSFKDIDLRRRRPAWILPAIALFFMAIAYRPIVTLLVLAVLFASSGPVGKIVSLLRRKKTATAG